MPRLVILSQSYSLPELPESVRDLAAASEKRAGIVESGEAPESSVLGMLTLSARQLTVEERFERLDELVRDYQAVVDALQIYRQDYRRFFVELGRGVLSTIDGCTSHIRDLDHKRRHLSQVAGETGDKSLLARTQELRERLVRVVRRSGHATLLILHQADNCSDSLRTAGVHQRRMQELLHGLTNRLRSHREMHQLEEQVGQFEGQPESTPRQAQEFAGYRRDFFDALHEILEQVITLDRELFRTVEEAEKFCRFLDPNGVGDLPPLGSAEKLLDLLAGARLSRDRMTRAVAQGSLWEAGDVPQDSAAAPAATTEKAAFAPGIDDALDNIAGFLRLRFERGFGSELLERARQENTPAVWQVYLAEYPEGLAVEEARRAVAGIAAGTPAGPAPALAHTHDGSILERLSAVPKNGVSLGELKPLTAQTGQGELQMNRGWGGKDIALVAGRPCQNYLAMHAPARVSYAIPPGVKRFTAVGTRIDDAAAAHGSWTYSVHVDGRVAFESSALHHQPAGIPIVVAIAPEARELTISVDDLGDSTADYSVLAYPYFHKSE